jgi:hypothetical protein
MFVARQKNTNKEKNENTFAIMATNTIKVSQKYNVVCMLTKRLPDHILVFLSSPTISSLHRNHNLSISLMEFMFNLDFQWHAVS